MKPYTVILQVRSIGSELPFTPSRPVPVYAHDETEAVIRTTRVLEMEWYDCRCTLSVKEGWDKELMPCG